MIIVFGNTSDEYNKLNKTFDNQYSIEGVLRNETSVTHPTILIDTYNPSSYNYMYIPDFNRYYYITDIVSVRNGLWRVSGKVDVLMSFKQGINTCPIVLANTQTTMLDRYMTGEMWKTLVKTKTDIINFPSGLNNTGEYILITSGG